MPSKRVAVVGGGPSGLFATYLINQRLPGIEVALFEASERLGGKVRTDRFDDGTPFEAGVAELYEYLSENGESRDPLRQLIEEDLSLPTVDMAGGGVVLRGKIVRGVEDLEECFSYETRKHVEHFHRKAAQLMPLAKYARRWQPDNEHPWANRTFRECIREEAPDEVARDYIEVAVASDLATESHTCNGLNGIKNVLMDNDGYMQLYHVTGGIERVVKELAKKIDADVCLECPVRFVAREGDQYRVSHQAEGAHEHEDFDAVLVAMPNHWLTQLHWGDAKLREAVHAILAHYDLPAHYLRVSMLFDRKWWQHFDFPGDFWMMDCFNGCCVYDESTRWRREQGHVLSFLLAGADALLQCSADQDDDAIVQGVLDSLPDWMRGEAEASIQAAQVSRFAGSINAQPGAWRAEELEGEHQPEPKGHPGLFFVGDYFFDSTLNGALISAAVATRLLADYLGITPEVGTEAVKEITDDSKNL